MATYTSAYRLIKQAFRDRSWHTPFNTMMDLIDASLGSVQSISLASGNVSLSTNNNAADTSRAPVTVLTGTAGVARTLTLPDIQRPWLFNNTYDAAVTLSSGAGTDVVLQSGEKALVYTDGATNVTLMASFASREVGILATSTEEDLETGNGKAYYRIPASLDGYRLHSVSAGLYAASSSGEPEFMIRNATQAVDMLSTAGSFAEGAKTSTDAVVNASNDEVATADQIVIDVDVAGTGAKGLFVNLLFYPAV